MSTCDINIATCHALPEPDLDQTPLMRALEEAGLRARLCDWRDAEVDWSDGQLTLIRSTWDYMNG